MGSVVGSYVIYSSVIIVINNKMIRYVFYLSMIIIIAKVTAEDDAMEDKLECSHNTKANVVQSIQCSKEATQKYLEEMFEDVETEKTREVPDSYTKPHYYARKTCNYLTAVLQRCFSCLPASKIAIQKDILFKKLLAKTETIPEFDNKKCPIIKEYLEKNFGALSTSPSILIFLSIYLIYLS